MQEKKKDETLDERNAKYSKRLMRDFKNEKGSLSKSLSLCGRVVRLLAGGKLTSPSSLSQCPCVVIPPVGLGERQDS